jgi:type II secretory pathway pseudopilin PulG
MIVVVLIGITVGMAMPSMRGSIRRGHVNRITNGLIADLGLTRVQAVRNGWPATIQFISTGHTISTTVNGQTRTIKQVDVRWDYPGATIIPPSASALTFNGRGILRSGQLFAGPLADDESSSIGSNRSILVLCHTNADGSCHPERARDLQLPTCG